MKLLILILNRVEALDQLLEHFSKAGIKGGTVIDSTGMARELLKNEDFNFFGSLRTIIDPERTRNKTLLFALHEEQIKTALDLINDVVGDLSDPDSGIVFTLPIDYIRGLKF
jgi:nitrogen regulatory protein PII